MKIKFFTTGGTIDMIYFDKKSEYQIGDPQACDLLKRANVVIDYDVKSIMRKDSLELTDEDRDIIYSKVKDEMCDRIIVTHGTDTMIQTAKKMEAIPDKTIVMTGSMCPARFADSDAIFNPFNARKNVQRSKFEIL